jgi:Tfp pilus assembly protein PilX
MNRMIDAIRRREEREDGFAMIMTIFLILIITVTTVAVAATMLQQVTPTNLVKKQIRTVDAASAGMQAALGQLRNTSTSGAGDLTKLPCSDPSDSGGVQLLVGSPASSVSVAGDQITGTVETTALSTNEGTYRTVIAYYSTDPTSHENDPDTSWWSANAIGCKAGLVKSVPTYAFIQSFGAGAGINGLSASEGDRTQHAIYQFSTTTTNIAGGRLAEFNSGAQDSMCLDALNPEPAVGTQPEFEQCQAAGLLQQTWEYRADLTLQYGGDTSLNLCIQNMGGSPTSTGAAKLEPCSTSGSGTTYPYANNTQQEQEWPFDDNGQLQAPNSSGGVGAGICLGGVGVTTSTPAAANAALVVANCSGSSKDYTSWNPDAQVGAGKSGSNTTGIPGSPTQQYVNYALFGRCLDVSGQNFANHLIAYPCKQAPDTTTLTWNQIWHFQTVSGNYGIFYTNCSANASGCVGGSTSTGEKDCLASPGTLNGAVYGVKCPSGTPPSNELWDPTGSSSGSYPSEYLLINQSDGLCMAADPGTLEPTSGITEIVVTDCSGQDVPTGAANSNYLLLKWNAPALPPTPGLGNIQEDGQGVTSTGN